MPAFAACWTAERAAHTTSAGGHARLRLLVSLEGRVVHTTLSSVDDWMSPEMNACVLEAARALELPPLSEVTRAEIPLELAPVE